MSVSRQSTVLVLVIVKKKTENTSKPEYNAKLTGPNTPITPVNCSHVCVCVQRIVHNTAQNNTSDNLPSYPPNTKHRTDLSAGGQGIKTQVSSERFTSQH